MTHHAFFVSTLATPYGERSDWSFHSLLPFTFSLSMLNINVTLNWMVVPNISIWRRRPNMERGRQARYINEIPETHQNGHCTLM